MPFDIPVPHLIGKTVQIFADGVILPEQVVSAGGFVTVANQPQKAFIGLSYPSLIETLPLTIQLEAGDSQGMLKRAGEVWLRTWKSVNAEVGPVEEYAGTWEPLDPSGRRRVSDHEIPEVGEIGDLEDWRFQIPAGSDSSSCVAIRQTQPLPLVILSVTSLFNVTEKQ